MTYPFAMLVAMVADRLARLARPRDGEPAPIGAAAPERWAELAGVNADPHAVLGKARRLDTEHDPADIARAALQRLVIRELVESAGDGRWRPTALSAMRSSLASVRGTAQAR